MCFRQEYYFLVVFVEGVFVGVPFVEEPLDGNTSRRSVRWNSIADVGLVGVPFVMNRAPSFPSFPFLTYYDFLFSSVRFVTEIV